MSIYDEPDHSPECAECGHYHDEPDGSCAYRFDDYHCTCTERWEAGEERWV